MVRQAMHIRMMNQTVSKLAAALLHLLGLFLVILSLSSCAYQQPEANYPQQADSERQQVDDWPALPEGVAVSTLNQLLDDTLPDDLLTTAFTRNPGLQQTWLTLQIRQAQLQQAEGQRLPEITATADTNRQQDADTRYESALAISWQADIWGQLADSRDVAALDLSAQQFRYQAARDLLGAEVIRAWLQLIANQRAVDIQALRLESLERTEAFILQRYRQGLGTLEDLDSARTATASATSRLQGLEEDLAQQRRDLRTLTGSLSRAMRDIPESYPSVGLSHVDLPAQTLSRRPDLRAAFADIEAASLQVDVAYKDLLPQLDLQAILQDGALTPRDALFAAPAWSLLAQLTAPLYQGGQRRAAIEIADLEAAIAYQDYRDTLLTAVNEVEQAISREHSLREQYQHTQRALNSARSNLEQFQERYRTGLSNILDLLTVQQQTFDLQAQLDDLQFRRLRNRVDLGLALGLEVQP